MKLSNQQIINASREHIFAALNDPEILKACIPGCNSLEKLSDTEMTATVTLKVGPIKAKFSGDVTLSNLNPPRAYTISGQGKAGPAGHAKGSAEVALIEQPDGRTLLTYTVTADVGGKIAQLGSRLMESTAKKLSGQFFEKFADIVESGKENVEPQPETAQPSVPETTKNTRLLWVLVAVGATAAAWYFTR